ncbi:hypothetical protein MMA231_03649 (plasmid) [Asticcacaulis sp. MM231]|uniref:asparagine synthase-related protein n=1 Tax=Asticcacaulis sp. MM231 TaxID=3157666 RepID=UPI0032D598C2
MALRYIAIVTRDSDRRARVSRAVSAIGLAQTVTSPAVMIHSNTPLLPLHGGIGAVVGDLFTRAPCSVRVQVMDHRASQIARDTLGQSFLTSYWGGYVAVIEDARGLVHVVRDPSAAMPCYVLKHEGAVLFASDVDVLVAAGFLTPEIDFSFLGRHLHAPDIRTPDTGLVGVQEVMAGFRLSIGAEVQMATQAWSPWDFVQADRAQSDAEMVEHLEETLLSCVAAWAGRYPRCLLGVSGGLDSSILAACLVEAGADLTCVTLATHEAEGDERAFARILRDRLQVPLVEAFHRPELVDFTRALSANLPRPIGHAFAQSNFGIRFELEKVLGIDAFFSGIGGDNVFCFTQSATALVDRFRSEGLGLGLVQTFADICHQNNASAGAVFRMAFQRYVDADPTYRFHGETRFLGPAAAHVSDSPLSHPWLHAPKAALPGKAAHIAMLAGLQGTIDGLPRDHAPQILPLISQPVMETCLRIPMWKWIAGGRNRSVARAAFARRLPKALIERTSKGGPNSFAYTVMEHHKDLVRERLTTGRLAQEGLIDARAVYEALAPNALIKPLDHMRLSDLAEAEAWVRHWEAVRKEKTAPTMLE